MLNILITGASGFIGSYLLEHFSTNGANVFAHSRIDRSKNDTDRIKWITNFDEISKIDLHLVINLAGANILEKRWSEKRKQELIDSRVFSTRDLYEWLDKNNIKPRMILNASSTAYYGVDIEKKWLNSCTEMSPPQPFFSSILFQELENEIRFFDQNSICLRLANVFAPNGGSLERLIKPIANNKFSQIDDGWNPINWVHIDDVIKAIKYIFYLNPKHRTFNIVAPERLSQRQFAYHTSRHLNKSGKFNNLPYLFFETLHGEMSDITVNGNYCKPNALTNLGFRFDYTYYQHAIHSLLPLEPILIKKKNGLLSGLQSRLSF